MIRARDLRLRYPGAARPVLDGVSLEVRSGELAVVVGPSGAGKSTLLRCLAGLERFDGGVVSVDGVEVAAERADGVRALRGRVGMVFQSFELFPHLSVLDNVTLAPRRARGMTRAAADLRARELLGELGLADKTAAYPPQLSGGQRQRVAIARALALEPAVLLYDEPTSALDPSLRGEVVSILKRLRERGITQLVVTHDHALTEAADQVFAISERGIVAVERASGERSPR